MLMKFDRLLLRKVLWQLAALTMAFLFVAPLYWVLSSSLRPVGMPPPHTLEWLPQPPAWSNYAEIFRIVPLGRQVANSILVSTVGAAITLLTASWAGFAMAQMPPGVRRWLVGLAVALLLIPTTAVWLPRYVLLSAIGLTDTYLALFAPAVMGTKALYVLMFYWTFRRIPFESFESARLEGAGALTIWRHIGMPAALPAALAVLLLAFSHYWSDFVDPLLFLKSEERYTLAVGLRMLQQMNVTNWSLLLAAVVVMTAPVIVVYLVLQHFIRSDAALPRLLPRDRT